jgi:hypothetical protein
MGSRGGCRSQRSASGRRSHRAHRKAPPVRAGLTAGYRCEGAQDGRAVPYNDARQGCFAPRSGAVGHSSGRSSMARRSISRARLSEQRGEPLDNLDCSSIHELAGPTCIGAGLRGFSPHVISQEIISGHRAQISRLQVSLAVRRTNSISCSQPNTPLRSSLSLNVSYNHLPTFTSLNTCDFVGFQHLKYY